MGKFSFMPSTPTEWLSIDTAAQWLGCAPAQVKTLAQNGQLRARTSAGVLLIDSGSVDAYTANRPLFDKPKPRTFVRTARGVIEEIT